MTKVTKKYLICGRRRQRDGRGQCSGASEAWQKEDNGFSLVVKTFSESFVKSTHDMCSTAPTGRQEASHCLFCPLVHFERGRQKVCPITSQVFPTVKYFLFGTFSRRMCYESKESLKWFAPITGCNIWWCTAEWTISTHLDQLFTFCSLLCCLYLGKLRTQK